MSTNMPVHIKLIQHIYTFASSQPVPSKIILISSNPFFDYFISSLVDQFGHEIVFITSNSKTGTRKYIPDHGVQICNVLDYRDPKKVSLSDFGTEPESTSSKSSLEIVPSAQLCHNLIDNLIDVERQDTLEKDKMELGKTKSGGKEFIEGGSEGDHKEEVKKGTDEDLNKGAVKTPAFTEGVEDYSGEDIKQFAEKDLNEGTQEAAVVSEQDFTETSPISEEGPTVETGMSSEEGSGKSTKTDLEKHITSHDSTNDKDAAQNTLPRIAKENESDVTSQLSSSTKKTTVLVR